MPACEVLLSIDHPQIDQMLKKTAMLNTTVNFVCRDNVEGLLFVFVPVFIRDSIHFNSVLAINNGL